MIFLRSSKCSKTTVELMFTTEKANASSCPQTACFVFERKYPFWVNLLQKPKIVSLSQNLVHRLIQICRIPDMIMITFSVFDWKYLSGQIWSKRLK